jgi:hypothetical protein
MKTNKILAAIVIATAGISSSFAATTYETFASLTNGMYFGQGGSYGPSLQVGSFTNNYTFTAPTTESLTFYAEVWTANTFSATLGLAGSTGQALTANIPVQYGARTLTGTFALTAGNTYTLSVSGDMANAFPDNYYYGLVSVPALVASVPEPETYAMLLAGLGVIGAIARRRKAAVAVA